MKKFHLLKNSIMIIYFSNNSVELFALKSFKNLFCCIILCLDDFKSWPCYNQLPCRCTCTNTGFDKVFVHKSTDH